MSEDLVKRIDSSKGKLSRSAFVVEAIEAKLGGAEISPGQNAPSKDQKLQNARDALAEAHGVKRPNVPEDDLEKWLKRRILQPDLRTLPAPIARREAMKERQHG